MATTATETVTKKIKLLRSGSIVMNQATVELTHNCNLKCVHCYLEHKSLKSELGTDGFKHVLDELAKNNVFFVAFTGGEILLRKDWFELLKYTKSKGIFFSLQTNGTLLDRNAAEMIAVLNPTKVEISLYGANERTHDGITRVKSSFIKSIAALNYLQALSIRTSIKMTVMSSNFAEIPEITALAKKMGAALSRDPIIMPGVYGSKDVLNLALNDEQYLEFMGFLGWGKDYDKELVPVEKKLFCRAGKTKFAISPHGDVIPCMLWRQSAGNLLEQPLIDIWNGQVFEQLQSHTVDDLYECKQCSYAEYCVRCPGAAYIEHGNSLAPSSQGCRLAKLMEVMANNEKRL